MKAKFFFTLIILITFFRFEVKAQATAYANIFATVVAPAAMTKEMDLSAGEIIASRGASSNALSVQNMIPSENVNLSKNGKTTVAAFQVTGKNSTYAITVQNQPVVLLNENANSVTVNNFTSEMAMIANTGEGAQRIRVSANLNVSENQPTGKYDSTAPFNVTLNYN
ncbi:MAG: DUF4402 domain-containing protein [Prolixibacteraceae bacterium]|jgi:hypothetical protein|nr:DUF4402 domain-containing protein [Prolixibacteraceae bacterium]